MKKVYLGGTCNESTWRDYVISKLEIDYFNPVVDDWTPECQEREIYEREHCNYCLYVITPKMTGVYSIAEVIDDSNKKPEKTLFCYLDEDINVFTLGQCKSLDNVGKMVVRNGGKWFKNLDKVIDYLNSYGWEKTYNE
jgi:hypothetical protein